MLLDLIEEHRSALEYDWRTRFYMGLSSVPEAMDWGEAYRLALVLARDPSSQLAAAVNDWEHPVTREDLALRDLYDMQHMSKAKKKPKPYPRPWDARAKKIGGGRAVSIAEFKALKARLADRE